MVASRAFAEVLAPVGVDGDHAFLGARSRIEADLLQALERASIEQFVLDGPCDHGEPSAVASALVAGAQLIGGEQAEGVVPGRYVQVLPGHGQASEGAAMVGRLARFVVELGPGEVLGDERVDATARALALATVLGVHHVGMSGGLQRASMAVPRRRSTRRVTTPGGGTVSDRASMCRRPRVVTPAGRLCALHAVGASPERGVIGAGQRR